MRWLGLGLALAAAWSAVLLSEPQSASVPSSASAPTTQAAPPPKVPPPSSAAPPVLSETDRLRVLNASQAVEIWTLRLQQAASEVQTARANFDRLVATVTPEGWSLNEKLEFVKVEKDK